MIQVGENCYGFTAEEVRHQRKLVNMQWMNRIFTQNGPT